MWVSTQILPLSYHVFCPCPCPIFALASYRARGSVADDLASLYGRAPEFIFLGEVKLAAHVVLFVLAEVVPPLLGLQNGTLYANDVKAIQETIELGGRWRKFGNVAIGGHEAWNICGGGRKWEEMVKNKDRWDKWRHEQWTGRTMGCGHTMFDGSRFRVFDVDVATDPLCRWGCKLHLNWSFYHLSICECANVSLYALKTINQSMCLMIYTEKKLEVGLFQPTRRFQLVCVHDVCNGWAGAVMRKLFEIWEYHRIDGQTNIETRIHIRVEVIVW